MFKFSHRPRVGISRCLLGDNVRYDGGHKRDALLMDLLGAHIEWVSVCPEVEVGMGTPREPIQLVASPEGLHVGRAQVRLAGVNTGQDWTARMQKWARDRIRELAAAQLSGFVLKKDSPSCGLEDVRVADVDANRMEGRGLFAQTLIEAMPDLPVEEEASLHEPHIRDRFLQRVFEHHARHLR